MWHDIFQSNSKMMVWDGIGWKWWDRMKKDGVGRIGRAGDVEKDCEDKRKEERMRKDLDNK